MPCLSLCLWIFVRTPLDSCPNAEKQLSPRRADNCFPPLGHLAHPLPRGTALITRYEIKKNFHPSPVTDDA